MDFVTSIQLAWDYRTSEKSHEEHMIEVQMFFMLLCFASNSQLG